MNEMVILNLDQIFMAQQDKYGKYYLMMKICDFILSYSNCLILILIIYIFTKLNPRNQCPEFFTSSKQLLLI